MTLRKGGLWGLGAETNSDGGCYPSSCLLLKDDFQFACGLYSKDAPANRLFGTQLFIP